MTKCLLTYNAKDILHIRRRRNAIEFLKTAEGVWLGERRKDLSIKPRLPVQKVRWFVCPLYRKFWSLRCYSSLTREN